MMYGSVEQQEIDVAFVLNHVPYLDVAVQDNMTLNEYIQYVETHPELAKAGTKEEFQFLKSACDRNPQIANIEIAHHSADNHTPDTVTDDMVQGVTFYDRSTDTYYIAFRGTGDGRWPDNAVQIGRLSPMDEAAAAYVDKVVGYLHLDQRHEEGCRIDITGHSKGGHEAQIAYLQSKYAAILDNCYSFDGHGTGKGVVDSFRQRTDYDYDEKIRNMYSINGDNDPVNALGEVIIVPKENTYYVNAGDPSKDIRVTHFISYIGGTKDQDGSWTYKGVNWAVNADGTIQNGEPGPICEYARRLNEYLFTLDPEDRDGAAKYAMYLIDYCFGSPYTIGEVGADWTDWVDLCAHGLPVAIAATLFTKEGRELLKEYIPILIEAVYKKYGVLGIVGVAFVIPVLSVFVADIVLFANLMDFVIDFYDKLKEAAIKTYDWVRNALTTIKDITVGIYEGIKGWFHRESAGEAYANSHPQIAVDTALLRQYAEQLGKINGRLGSLDRRMDSLYSRVGLFDLWKLLQADLLTRKSRTITKCVAYLNDTRAGFEQVEAELQKI